MPDLTSPDHLPRRRPGGAARHPSWLPRQRRGTTESGGAHRLQRARYVAIAGYSIETPRLLLASVSRRFPHRLGNNADQVGRYVMV